MDKNFHIGNRKTLYDTLKNNTLMLCFAGEAKHYSADAYFDFFTNRNFVYLTGISGPESAQLILMAHKKDDCVEEKIFILAPDVMLERWNGRRLKIDEVKEMSGIENVFFLDGFETIVNRLINSCKIETVALDLWKNSVKDADTEALKFAHDLNNNYPSINLHNYHLQLRKQRTIKKDCEIEAMRKALDITKQGIENMMKASKPGMFEYEYKAEFDHALTSNGVLAPGFHPIISTGTNNFYIHYNGYFGQSKDGDMILNDVGAVWDNICTDVSRGWPCNGKFSEKQKALYTCAYNTSEYMFSIIKPGMLMSDVDLTVKKYCFEELKKIGLLEKFEDIGKYIWHGGAHHVGYDVHDQVDVTGEIEAGMVFCVDVGIYVEEWGIGFRVEDNCLVTDTGCENLSKDIPRTIEEIESLMNC